MRKETLLFSWAAALSAYINAFTPESQRLQQFQSPSRSLSSSVSLGALPPNYEDIGTQIIQDAGISCGMKSLEDLEIEWGVARVVVTVRGKVHLSTPDEVGEPSDEDGEDDELPDPEAVSGVDITQLARAINFALGEDEVGNAIAETHEIEVTTAGASGKPTVPSLRLRHLQQLKLFSRSRPPFWNYV